MEFEDDDKKEAEDKESEDSQEEDSEKESEDTSDDSSEDDEEDEEEQEDISKKYFTDPNSLPKELRGAFKRMQGNYTRRMQEATLGIKKAQAFDQLIMDPEFRDFMEKKRTGVITKSKSANKADDSEDEDEDAPITRKSLRSEIANAMSPMLKQRQDDEMREEAKQFRKDNPDWEMFKEPMMEILSKHPSLSYQDAYELASAKENKHLSSKESLEAKKRANIKKPSKTQGKEVTKKGRMTIAEAYELAKKKVGLK